MKEWVKLVAAILICQAAGFIGSIFTYSSVSTWYQDINKPGFNPPDWVFAPVWFSLFTLMGISLYEVWGEEKAKIPIVLFSSQLILNVVWSFLFFGLHLPFYALAEVIMLWIAILATIISFFRISKSAALLMIPYLLWVSLAAVLNYYVFILNP